MKGMAGRTGSARLGSTVLMSALLCLGVPRGSVAGVNAWTAIGPEGAVACLTIDPVTPTTLYVVSRDGSGTSVLKSTNRGGEWSLVGRGGGCPLLVDPGSTTTMYYPGFKSTDGGATWRALSLPIGPYAGFPTTMAIDPQTPATLYLGAFSKPYVDSSLWRRCVTRSFSSPRSTATTCPTPNDCPTRTTQERIFCAMTSASATSSVSPRQMSQALQEAAV